MNLEKINNLFKKINQQQILIIGDIMVDSYMWGNIERISPEAPVPIISATKRENRMGGAANVGLNVLAMGAKPIMCAVIGDDRFGKVLLDLLEKRGMQKEGIIVSNKRKTTIKTRIISSGQHLLRVDEEETDSLNPELENKFINHVKDLLNKNTFDAIIFEDYDKGNITPNIIKDIVTEANKRNIPTLVDPKKRNYNFYKEVTLFKPNFKEICEGSKVEIPKGDFDALHKLTKKLSCDLDAKAIMVTLSELGVFINYNNNYKQLKAEVRNIADVSGAGDTVISVAACCLAAGCSFDEVAAISNLAGGLVCEKVGVVPIDKNNLKLELVNFFDN